MSQYVAVCRSVLLSQRSKNKSDQIELKVPRLEQKQKNKKHVKTTFRRIGVQLPAVQPVLTTAQFRLSQPAATQTQPQ